MTGSCQRIISATTTGTPVWTISCVPRRKIIRKGGREGGREEGDIGVQRQYEGIKYQRIRVLDPGYAGIRSGVREY